MSKLSESMLRKKLAVLWQAGSLESKEFLLLDAMLQPEAMYLYRKAVANHQRQVNGGKVGGRKESRSEARRKDARARADRIRASTNTRLSATACADRVIKSIAADRCPRPWTDVMGAAQLPDVKTVRNYLKQTNARAQGT